MHIHISVYVNTQHKVDLCIYEINIYVFSCAGGGAKGDNFELTFWHASAWGGVEGGGGQKTYKKRYKQFTFPSLFPL